MRKPQKPLPREHGAWGLLLQPFVAAAVLAKQWDWLLIPALLLVLLGFLVREPLVILARCRWAGHSWGDTARMAVRWLIVESVGMALCFLLLCAYLPSAPLCILSAVALVLTLVSVWFTVKNRQRSVALQIVAVGGLGSSAFLAALSSVQALPEWAWWIWGLLTLHGMVAVLCVHARLRLRTATKRSIPSNPLRMPLGALIGQALLILPAAVWGSERIAAVILFSVLLNAMEILRLTKPVESQQPLRQTGFRMLTQSLAHSVVAMAMLWNLTV